MRLDGPGLASRSASHPAPPAPAFRARAKRAIADEHDRRHVALGAQHPDRVGQHRDPLFLDEPANEQVRLRTGAGG